MKNFRLTYFIAALLPLVMWSCEKTYEEHYRITYFPEFEIKGENVIFNPFGSPYTDPGVKATEGGKEIPVTTEVSGDYFGGTSFEANSADRYLYTYSATNSDGFSASASRSVYNVKTGDLVNSIEGLYTSTVVRNNVSSAQYTNMKYVLIAKSGNVYKLSDAIGGYYDIGRAYGATYRATGITITANNIAANDFSFAPATVGVGAFGGALNMVSMTVDAAAKTIQFTSAWDAGYTFKVTLKQVQL